MSQYTEEGYKSRTDYLMSLAEDLGLDVDEVFAMADILGSSEDFDGLVTACEDRAAELEHKAARQ
jgi:energy-converting hydrogenase A subunit M